MPEQKRGEVITFYSYKGGTGRTMALANVACLLAKEESVQKGILMIDWDLEAPGLHRFFYPQNKGKALNQMGPSFEEALGLIDLFYKFDTMNFDEYESNTNTQELLKRILANIDINQYIQQTDIPKISLMKAGKFDTDYPTRVNTFKWDKLFEKQPWIYRALAEELSERFDYILIDSRTGITDTSGICTMIMPEKLVVVFVPNQQSLTGVSDLVKRAVEYRKSSDDLRPLVIFPLPSRIEATQPDLREKWRKGDIDENILGYQPEFEKLFANIYGLEINDLEDYFDNVQIQHIPYYAYGEKIAVQLERSEDSLSIAKSYVSFTDKLLSTDIPWIKSNKNQVSTPSSTNPLNPFIYGRPLLPSEFISRARELRQIIGYLKTGQAMAIVGQRHVGKTSLLRFLADTEYRINFMGENSRKDFYVFIDLLTMQNISSQADFWKYALSPLKDSELQPILSDLVNSDNDNFFVIEKCLAKLDEVGRRLILCLDEFDTVLSHPVLNNSGFYGGLRSLASRSKAFSLVIATKRTMEELNTITSGLNRFGSPYFNLFISVHIGILSVDEFNLLLDKGLAYINRMDREYIARVSGRHPYLAQAAAAMIWDAQENGLSGEQRYLYAGENLYRLVNHHYADVWRNWTTEYREIVVLLALNQLLNNKYSFQNLANFAPELGTLKRNGIIYQNEQGGWDIAQQAMLWWLADGLIKNARSLSSLNEWVCLEGDYKVLNQSDVESVFSLLLDNSLRDAHTLIEEDAKSYTENLKSQVYQLLLHSDPEALLGLLPKSDKNKLCQILLEFGATKDETATLRSRAVRGLSILGKLDVAAWFLILPTASKELFQEWFTAWGDPSDTTVLNAELVRILFDTRALPKSTTGLGKAVRRFIERGAGYTSAVFLPGSTYPAWEVKYDCVRTIISLDDIDSLRTLASFSTMSYWKARRRIIEYIQDKYEGGGLTPDNKKIAIEILHQFTTDGKSDESTPTLRSAHEMLDQLTKGRPAISPISDSIAAVLDGNGNIVGSAFLAASQYLLTCAHVVQAAGRQPNEKITVQFRDRTLTNALIDPTSWRPIEDVAILILDEPHPSNISPLPLGDSASSTFSDFRSFGYPSTKGVVGLNARGEILGFAQTGEGQSFLQLKAQQLAQGYSGAPVWDEKTRRVVGMVSQVYIPGDDTRNRDTAFAIPVDVLRQVLKLV